MKFHRGGEAGVVAEKFGHGAIEARAWRRPGLRASRAQGETNHDGGKNNQMLSHKCKEIITFADCFKSAPIRPANARKMAPRFEAASHRPTEAICARAKLLPNRASR